MPFPGVAGAASAASESSIVVTVTMLVTVSVAVATAFPKVLGPLAKAWEDWTLARRRAQSTTRDAHLTMLQEHSAARDKLLDEAWAEAARARERDRERTARLLAHEQDDIAADLLIIRLGAKPPPRTPLFGVCPTTGAPARPAPDELPPPGETPAADDETPEGT